MLATYKRIKRERCRLQFSLRSLFLLTLVLALGLGWFMTELRQAGRQRRAVAAVVKRGGQVWYSDGSVADYVTYQLGNRASSSARWLSRLFGDDFLLRAVEVDFPCRGNPLPGPANFAGVHDDDLTAFQDLPRLHRLRLADTEVTDAGLTHIERLSNLHELDLRNTQIGDSGLRQLKRLNHLELLRLEGTRITDDGLAQLGGLLQLRELYLDGTPISDAGLLQIGRLRNLQRLGLGYTQVTHRGLQELKALPALQALGLSTDTRVTDRGMDYLARCTSLRSLDLLETRISDRGLEKLKNLTALRSLDVGSTLVTDAGLWHLKSLTQLRQLGLCNARASPDGVCALRWELPNCTIVTDGSIDW